MKKLFSLGLMLVATFTLTNCAKELVGPEQEPQKEGVPFEIVASTKVDSKTTNDGVETNWEANDAINVWHAPAGESAYKSEGEFSISAENLDAQKFTGTISNELSSTNDWYVLYPYSEYKTDPTSSNSGFTYIGHKELVQNGYDNTAHLSDNKCPLYGIQKNVDGAVFPEITMQHLTSVVALNITNTLEEPLTITSASITAEEEIVGSFKIDITGNEVSYEPSSANVVAGVTVSNGTALAKGESAKVYIIVKPFTVATGKELTITVNDCVKTVEMTKDVVFSAGTIKTIPFKYDYVFESESFVLAESISVGDEIIFVSGNAGTVSVMGAQASNNRSAVTDVNVSNSMIVSTEDMAVFTVGAGETAPAYFTFYDSSAKGYLYAASSGNNYLRTQSTVDVNAEWEVIWTAGVLSVVATGSSNRNILRYNSANDLFSCYKKNQDNSLPQNDIYIFKKSSATAVSATPTETELSYEAGSSSFSYMVANASGATSVSSDDVTITSHDEVNQTVEFSYTKNDTGADKELVITITNNNVSCELTIVQKPAPTKLVMSDVTATPSSNSISYAWGAVAGATSYQVKVGADGEWETVKSPYTLAGLEPATEYTVSFKAIGDGGLSYLDSEPKEVVAETTEESGEVWTLVSPKDAIVEGTYVLVASTSTLTGALVSTNGSSSSPSYITTISVLNDNLTGVTDAMKFDLTKVEGGYKLAAFDQTTNYLYTTNSNAGVRVGTNVNNVWTITAHESNADAFCFKCNATSRYLGVYNNLDWRCYTTYNASNYTNDKGSSQIYLYKLSE